MTGEGGVAGEGKKVRVGAACTVHSAQRIARSVVGRSGKYSTALHHGASSCYEFR